MKSFALPRPFALRRSRLHLAAALMLFHWLRSTFVVMCNPSLIYVEFTGLHGVLGLWQVLRPWVPKSPVCKWNLCSSKLRRNFIFLVICSILYPLLLILFRVFGIQRIQQWDAAHQFMQELLLELSWLNGFGAEVCIKLIKMDDC